MGLDNIGWHIITYFDNVGNLYSQVTAPLTIAGVLLELNSSNHVTAHLSDNGNTIIVEMLNEGWTLSVISGAPPGSTVLVPDNH